MRWGVWSPLFCRAALSGVPKGEYAVKWISCNCTATVRELLLSGQRFATRLLNSILVAD